jgi:putative addiction module component (TIGR02574 family)
MSMTVAEILIAAQALPPRERETLCTKIAESLDAPLTPEEEAWAEVAERRVEELRSGKVKGIPADEVFAKARRRLGL